LKRLKGGGEFGGGDGGGGGPLYVSEGAAVEAGCWDGGADLKYEERGGGWLRGSGASFRR
jgi:hypothetical protein